jgi:hypothetical protein
MARKIRWSRVHCPVCYTLITNNALGRERHISSCSGHPEKYAAHISGSSWSQGRGPRGFFNTIREARAWAESYGTTADWCEISTRSGRKVGEHRRVPTGATWCRASFTPEA